MVAAEDFMQLTTFANFPVLFLIQETPNLALATHRPKT
jgi:hypothetical protein